MTEPTDDQIKLRGYAIKKAEEVESVALPPRVHIMLKTWVRLPSTQQCMERTFWDKWFGPLEEGSPPLHPGEARQFDRLNDSIIRRHLDAMLKELGSTYRRIGRGEQHPLVD